MGYPPPPRRLSDKKRYYYSNNPNRRHINPYVKKPYTKPYSNNYSSKPYGSTYVSQSVASEASAKTAAPSTPEQHIIQTNSTSEAARPSRYDPTTTVQHVQSTTSFPKTAPVHTGSRYNPESDILHQPSPVHVSTSTQIGRTTAAPTSEKEVPSSSDAPKSRYSRSTPSRYNPYSSNDAGSSIYDSSSIPTPSALSQYLSHGHRPRSMDSINTELNYSYSHNTVPDKASSLNSNSTTAFFNRSNKWRAGTSFSSSSLNTEGYSNTQFAEQRQSFWKTPNGRHSSSSTNLESSYAHRYDNHNLEQDKDMVRTDEEPEFETDKHDYSKKECPLSPGSSLIHSVPQTTREVADIASAEHKRINLSGSRVGTPIPSNVDEDSESEYNDSVAESASRTDNLESKTMWSSETSKLNELITKSESLPEAEEGLLSEDRDRNENNKSSQDIKLTEENKPTTEALDAIRNDTVNNLRIESSYEYVSDPKLLKTDISKLQVKDEESGPFKETFPEPDACIFPMKRVETKLWDLRNRDRKDIISKQKYLLKNSIKSLKEYPFLKNNVKEYRKNKRHTLLESFKNYRLYEVQRRLLLKGLFIKFSETWENDCEKMEKISNDIKREELEYKKQLEIERVEREKKEAEAQAEYNRLSGSSRRRNRADFVDDTEMESVLLQIDPDYKHHQAAADIPAMLIDPVEKFTFKFQNVNNLITDKDQWASRLLVDGVDNFSEHEHKLFIEGYLNQPKKFGKISHFMGGLRTPEECVLHYYKTKKRVNYKLLLLEKNKKRKSHASKRRKKKEKSVDTEIHDTADESLNIDNAVELPVKSETPLAEIEVPSTVIVQELPIVPEVITQVDEMEVTDKNGITGSIIEDTEIEPIQELEHQVQPVLENIVEAPEIKEDVAISEIATIPVKRPFEMVVTEEQHVDNYLYNNVETHEHDLSTETVSSEMLYNTSNPDDVDKYDFNQVDGQKRKMSKLIADHKSSYWSVKEAQVFPSLLEKYGSQWSLISEKLTTKSTTMVRNYYQRNAAQYGWKAIVEESDLKRNAKSSGSVQQTQILVQPEQVNALSSINGIPPQQKPALGFFSNQQTDQRIVSTENTPTQQTFAADIHRDSFASVATPTSTLPPPRLPSIQLQPNLTQLRQPLVSPTDALKHIPMASTEPANSTNVSQKESGTRTNISDIMNNIKNDHGKSSGQDTSPHTNISIKSFLNNATPSKVNERGPIILDIKAVSNNPSNIVVQDLPLYSSAENVNSRASSISALLNPVSNAEPMKTIPAYSSTMAPPIQLNEKHTATKTATAPGANTNFVTDYNFANDPLAALAAVASAPETLASIMPGRSKTNTGT